MSWLSQSTLKWACGLRLQGRTLPSSLVISKSPLACHCLTLRAISSSASGRRPVDDNIPFKFVRLADPESGSLHPPAPLKSILNSIDRKTHHVELVSSRPDPIVKIVDTKQARDKYREVKKRAQAAARAQVRKEIQLTWGVAEGDLAHKLGKARQELMRGKKVDLIFASKEGQVPPTKQAVDDRLKGVLDALVDVGREYIPRRVQKKMVAMYFRPLGES